MLPDFSALVNSFSQVIGSYNSFRSSSDATISADTMKTMLSEYATTHTAIAASISSLDGVTRQTWINDRLLPNNIERHDHDNAVKLYETYRDQLTGKAILDERRAPLNSLIKANTEMAEALRRLLYKIKDATPDTTYKLSDFRVSDITMLGAFKASETLANFSMYMFAGLVGNTLVKVMDNAVPKYRTEYMFNNCAAVSELVNTAYSQGGLLQITDAIDAIREKGADVKLINLAAMMPDAATTPGTPASPNPTDAGGLGGDGTTSSGVDFSNISIWKILATIVIVYTVVKAFIAFAIPAVKQLRNGNFGLAADQNQMKSIQRQREAREWMARHVSILRLELSQVSPDDPRYRQLSKVIEAYDEKITEYDRAIAAREGSIRYA